MKAPNLDLELIKNLYVYRSIDEKISQISIEKFCNHLWYLSSEPVAFSLFDEEVSLEVKEEMRQILQTIDVSDEEMPIPSKRFTCKPSEVEEIVKKELHQFISPETKTFFTRFNPNVIATLVISTVMGNSRTLVISP